MKTDVPASLVIPAALINLLLVAAAPGFSQPSDPPGFAPISLAGGQVVGLNAVCFEHQVGLLPPDPCHGELMFHDAAGRVLKRTSYDLKPGEAGSLRLAIPATNAAGERIARVTIVPCVIPAPGGRAIPSVEIFDREAGRVIQFETPAAARMTDFNNAPDNPGVRVGFDPQPDPPGFGFVTLSTGESIRMNLFCFDHEVNGVPPNPCKGIVMFHDAAGNDLLRTAIALQPGQSKSVEFTPDRAGGLVGIDPCWIPARGGRVVPNAEVFDTASGNVALLMNPAVARMSSFQ